MTCFNAATLGWVGTEKEPAETYAGFLGCRGTAKQTTTKTLPRKAILMPSFYYGICNCSQYLSAVDNRRLWNRVELSVSSHLV